MATTFRSVWCVDWNPHVRAGPPVPTKFNLPTLLDRRPFGPVTRNPNNSVIFHNNAAVSDFQFLYIKL